MVIHGLSLSYNRRGRATAQSWLLRSHLALLVALAALVVLLTLGALATAAAPASAPADTAAPAAAPADPALVLEAIEASGNTRTGLPTIGLYLPLTVGEPVDQGRLLAAVEELRRSRLFAQVDFYTRPGSARGRIVLLLEVREKEVEFRLGTGNTDLEGWYLIPAQVAFDNRLGRGERIDLQLKFGYRQTGLVFVFDEPRLGDGRSYWGFQASSLVLDRVYFFDDLEHRHRIERGRWEVHVGRQLTSLLTVEVGARVERVDADSLATLNEDDQVRGLERGDERPFASLPVDVARDVGERRRSGLRLDLRLDSRGRTRVAGSPTSGLWGRLRLEGTLDAGQGFGAASLDLRGFQGLGGGVLAGRLHLAGIEAGAPFYDRLYLGGLYSVRGFPSQSLSAPGGETWLWSASCEFRAPLAGSAAAPRLAGVLFLDAGDSGRGGLAEWREAAAGVGFGLRLRVAWLGWIGLDVGLPLTESPVDESFHAHASIGWSF